MNNLRKALSELSSLRAKVDILLTSKETNKDLDPTDQLLKPSIIDELGLPVANERNLDVLEERLSIKANEIELINFLARLGGSSVGDACRRALRACLSDELACHYSWLGQKGKKVFSALKLNTVIINSILKQFKAGGIKQVECVIKDWLRASNYRIQNRQKSKS